MDQLQTHAQTFDLLVQARTTIDRMTIERSRNLERIAQLETETEAMREMVAAVARGGRTAVL